MSGGVAAQSLLLWRVQEVEGWLKAVGLGQYAQAFARLRINGRALLSLSDEELGKSGLGLSSEHRTLFRRLVKELEARTIPNQDRDSVSVPSPSSPAFLGHTPNRSHRITAKYDISPVVSTSLPPSIYSADALTSPTTSTPEPSTSPVNDRARREEEARRRLAERKRLQSQSQLNSISIVGTAVTDLNSNLTPTEVEPPSSIDGTKPINSLAENDDDTNHFSAMKELPLQSESNSLPATLEEDFTAAPPSETRDSIDIMEMMECQERRMLFSGEEPSIAQQRESRPISDDLKQSHANARSDTQAMIEETAIDHVSDGETEAESSSYVSRFIPIFTSSASSSEQEALSESQSYQQPQTRNNTDFTVPPLDPSPVEPSSPSLLQPSPEVRSQEVDYWRFRALKSENDFVKLKKKALELVQRIHEQAVVIAEQRVALELKAQSEKSLSNDLKLEREIRAELQTRLGAMQEELASLMLDRGEYEDEGQSTFSPGTSAESPRASHLSSVENSDSTSVQLGQLVASSPSLVTIQIPHQSSHDIPNKRGSQLQRRAAQRSIPQSDSPQQSPRTTEGSSSVPIISAVTTSNSSSNSRGDALMPRTNESHTNNKDSQLANDNSFRQVAEAQHQDAFAHQNPLPPIRSSSMHTRATPRIAPRLPPQDSAMAASPPAFPSLTASDAPTLVSEGIVIGSEGTSVKDRIRALEAASQQSEKPTVNRRLRRASSVPRLEGAFSLPPQSPRARSHSRDRLSIRPRREELDANTKAKLLQMSVTQSHRLSMRISAPVRIPIIQPTDVPAFTVEVDVESGDQMEYSINLIPDTYSDNFLTERHWNIVCVPRSNQHTFIVSVLENRPPDSRHYVGLMNSRKGFQNLAFPVADVMKAKGATTMKKLTNFLMEKYDCVSYLVKEEEFAHELATVEKRHRQRRDDFMLSIILCHSGQKNPLEMFANRTPLHFVSFIVVAVTKEFSRFLKVMGVNESAPDTPIQWQNLTVRYHVAPFMTPEGHRRLIGNDRTILFFLEEPDAIFDPSEVEKLGHMPQCFMVVRPFEGGKYHVASFRRVTMRAYGPYSPKNYAWDATNLCDFLLTKAYNGIIMTMFCPPINRLFETPRQNTIDDIVKRFPRKKKGVKGMPMKVPSMKTLGSGMRATKDALLGGSKEWF